MSSKTIAIRTIGQEERVEQVVEVEPGTSVAHLLDQLGRPDFTLTQGKGGGPLPRDADVFQEVEAGATVYAAKVNDLSAG